MPRAAEKMQMVRQDHISTDHPCVRLQPSFANESHSVRAAENTLTVLSANGDHYDDRLIPRLFGRPMHRLTSARLPMGIGRRRWHGRRYSVGAQIFTRQNRASKKDGTVTEHRPSKGFSLPRLSSGALVVASAHVRTPWPRTDTSLSSSTRTFPMCAIRSMTNSSRKTGSTKPSPKRTCRCSRCCMVWRNDNVPFQLTLTLSPRSCHMLRDPLLRQRYGAISIAPSPSPAANSIARATTPSFTSSPASITPA